MPDVVQNAERGFWQAPVPSIEQNDVPAPVLAAACERCGAEFVVGAGFCHVCGAMRHASPAQSGYGYVNWSRFLQLFYDWIRSLEFHNIKARLGLSTAPLIAFLIGIGCVLMAVLTGLVFTAATVADWQSVQAWRVEWLLASVAAFLAGILLKRPSER